MLDIQNLVNLNAKIRKHLAKLSSSEAAEIKKYITEITKSHDEALREIKFLKNVVREIVETIEQK
jgi:methyl-accepting chemotaxis protein